MAFFQDPNAPTLRPQGPFDAQPNSDATGSQGLNANAPTALPGGGSVTYGPNGQVLSGVSGPGAAAPTAGGAAPPFDPKNPAAVDAWLAYMAKQPGVDPSVGNDPNYWKQKILSGELGPDAGYIQSKMTQTPGSGQAAGGSLQGAMGGMGGDMLAPYTGQFSAPTGTDDPGFQFAVQQGQAGIQRSAAAKGTLLTGGTLKDLASYTTGAALQDYSGAYNRALQTFGTNYDVFRNNQNDPFNKLYATTNLGLGAASGYSGSLGQGNSLYADATNPTNRINLGIDAGNIGGQNAINQGNQQTGYANAGGNLANALVPWFNRPKTTATYNPSTNPSGYGGYGAT
jgi:hypothetical protein